MNPVGAAAAARAGVAARPAGVGIGATDEHRTTALILAAYKGHTEAVSALVHAGANLEATNKNGSTALMSAAFNGHTEAVSALVQAGADIEATDNNGNTALMGAAVNGKTEAVSALVHAGADIEATDNNGNTALMGAAVNGKTEAVTQAITDGKQALMDEFQEVRDKRKAFSLVTLRLNPYLQPEMLQHIVSFCLELSDAQINMAKKYIREQ